MDHKLHVKDKVLIEYLRETIDSGKCIAWDSSKVEIHLMDKDPLAYCRFTNETHLLIFTTKDLLKMLPSHYALSNWEDIRK